MAQGQSPLDDRPRVSVGLPVYSGERFLRGAFDSILAQDVEGLEVVVCDNASTDTTQEICHGLRRRPPPPLPPQRCQHRRPGGLPARL